MSVSNSSLSLEECLDFVGKQLSYKLNSNNLWRMALSDGVKCVGVYFDPLLQIKVPKNVVNGSLAVRQSTLSVNQFSDFLKYVNQSALEF